MIPYGKHCLDEADIQAVAEVLRSGLLTQGPVVEDFEKGVADYVGAKYAVALSSGTAALHLAAIVAGVRPGTMLITSPITFVASANAGIYAGGSVTFADIEPETINLSPQALSSALKSTSNVKAIVPVHFGGLPCDMAGIKPIADQAGAVVIEDAAHALGATYPNGSRVGCCENSLMTIFSFHPVKTIAAGEGGMITTNDADVYRRLLRLRSHGINKLDDPFLLNEQAYTDGVKNPWYYEVQELGFHYRITDIQCALGLSQLGKLEKFLARRREIVMRYDAAFTGMKHCKPAQPKGRDRSGLHLYVLRISFKELRVSRAKLMELLKARGIGTQVHYVPVPMQPLYRSQGCVMDSYPAALTYYEETLSVPLYYGLTDGEQDYVIKTLKEFLF